MEKNYAEIDLRELLRIMRKRLWIILVITCLATLITGVVSIFVLTPQYQASAEILVNQSSLDGQYSQGEIRTNLDLINTYQVIMTSPRILEKVREDYNLGQSAGQLKKQMNVSSVRNSQVMSVTVTDPSHEQAVYIANAVAKTFQTEIKTLMNIDNVHIMAEANSQLNPSPVQPKPYLNMAIAFVVGLMASIGLVFLLEYFDNTIKTEQDVEQILGLVVLGSIAKMDDKTEKKLKAKLEQRVGGEQIEA